METALIVTKGKLMSLQRSLSLAKTGYELMDKKRNILMREMLLMLDKANKIQSEMDGLFSDAYKSLEKANISYGVIQSIADSVPIDNGVSIKLKSIIGIEVPIVSCVQTDLTIPYGFTESNTFVDTAYINFLKIKDLCLRLAEVENTIYRLATAVKKIQRRANALKNVLIPRLEANIGFIENSLEEKEREEFSRLKLIKK
jgi:V/A-type H+-transporting ATPase subunit D